MMGAPRLIVPTLTEHELADVVNEALKGQVPLEVLVHRAIFGDNAPPTRWGDWPMSARAAWDLAMALFQDAKDKGEPVNRKGWTRNTLTLPESWEVVITVAPFPRRWWLLPGVTWEQIGALMQITARSAAYRMRSLGWVFNGAGMNVPGRRVRQAPCESCGAAWAPVDIHGHKGPCCKESRRGPE